MMKILIREAKQRDLPEILSLLDSLSKTKSEPKIALKMFRELLRRRIYYPFVAEFEEKIIGAAFIFIIPSLQHGKPWGHIDDVVVAEEYQRKGIGKKLVAALINFAREKNCYKIVLTSRFTRPGAHQFWLKCGFQKHGFSFRMDL